MATKSKAKNRKSNKTYYGKRRVSKIHRFYRYAMLVAMLTGGAGVGGLWYQDRQETNAKVAAYDADMQMRKIIAEGEVDAQVTKLREEQAAWDRLPPPPAN